MPKFTYEIDTDEKTAKAFIDGVETDVDEFSVGTYKNMPYSEEKDVAECYLSLTKKDGKDRLTYSYSFRNGENGHSSETISRFSAASIAKQVAKAIGTVMASVKLSQALENRRGN